MTDKRPFGVIVLCVIITLGSGVATAAPTTGVDGAPAGEMDTTASASASIVFNDQTSAGASVDIASYDLGSDGETIALWSMSNGSPDQLLGTVSPETQTGATTITLDTSVSENQTLVAAVHSGEPTTENVLTFDTAAIVVDLNPSLGDNPPARNVDNDPLLEDVNGDSKTDIFDVLTYYNNRLSDAVQTNPDQFDYDGDGTVGTIFDAVTLYNKIDSS